MLNPEYLTSIPDAMIELYAQVESDILADMARRINTYDYFIPSAEWQRKKLLEMGLVRGEVIDKMSRISGKSEEELKRLMKEAGIKTLEYDNEIYKKAGLNPMPLLASPALKQVLEVGYQKTNKLFKNLTETTANTATKQFEDALDRAWLQITSGAFDSNTAIRRAVKDLARQGVGAIRYPTGHIDSLEVAVRRATLTGVNQACGRLQIASADEMDCDLVEVTAHAGARPSHADWQGKIFSRSGDSIRYPNFETSTGYGSGAGLCGWNCRHSFFPFFEGISTPAYTPEMLKEYDAKNYEYNGQKMTEYEATQNQRQIERNIRRWKREYKAMEAAGLDTAEAKAKIAKWNGVQKDFLVQTGLKRQADREQISGFGKSHAQKVVQANKQAVKAYAQQHISSVTLNNSANNGIINTTRRFSDRNEADKLFRPWTEEIWPMLSLAEREAAYQYTCDSGPFNRPLRGYDGSWDKFIGVGKVSLNNEGAESFIASLTQGIQKSELKEDVWLFRGSDQQSLAGLLGIDKSKIIPSNVDALNRKFAGETVRDPSFFSTGIAADAGLKDKISYEILAPKGTKGIYAEPFSLYGGTNTTGDWNGKAGSSLINSEAEVILQAGTKFEVQEIKLVGEKVTVMLKVLVE